HPNQVREDPSVAEGGQAFCLPVITGEGGQPDRVAEFVFHRTGRPIVDYRKAWLTACVSAGLAQPKLDAQGRPVLDSQGRPRMAATKLVHDLRLLLAPVGVGLVRAAAFG